MDITLLLLQIFVPLSCDPAKQYLFNDNNTAESKSKRLKSRPFFQKLLKELLVD